MIKCKIMKGKILVSIVMGSDSDLPIAKNTTEILDKLRIGYEVKILSAHRTPEQTAKYAKGLKGRGIEVVIALAGGAFHLAGVIAAYTTLPVIAVPLSAPPFNGLDSFLATLQMPRGVPVAVMAVGKWGAVNAGIFASEILALRHSSINKSLSKMRKESAKKVLEKNKKLSCKKK
jgi:phosphoribosylaminoimidazole carboxylase PurE protein